ncbi:hypothetical protein FN846DRAFT_908336 [Sphaerosporella brunnea]|uniref:Uncharacterized protein n=1 Tax=Sphaerosporella brunnea TaxID=1250544 RepID=A0A5J5ESX5_9PEZI|nr:hypothetical protein FN846DRAFT_908336 [Sphaerosporella brunnea]
MSLQGVSIMLATNPLTIFFLAAFVLPVALWYLLSPIANLAHSLGRAECIGWLIETILLAAALGLLLSPYYAEIRALDNAQLVLLQMVVGYGVVFHRRFLGWLCEFVERRGQRLRII